MAINPNVFIHESDRATLQALKAIPGFTQVLKSFMSIWNEKQYKLLNMSSYIKISDEQMKKYNDMLIPICEKLGIDVPELYIKLSPVVNAWTSGENSPFIVLTTGLINTIPEHLIPTVLAHECGHIACHHVLYSTMGSMILNGTISLLGLGQLMTMPIQMAFAYWMRCSEYSADRVAAYCDGTADNMVDTCMYFAGYDKNFDVEANRQAFMNQALEYKDMVDSSKWNKTLEFLMFNQIDHPLCAVRAYELNEWAKGTSFDKLIEFCGKESGNLKHDNIPMAKSFAAYYGKKFEDVVNEFYQLGFDNVTSVPTLEKNIMIRNGQVVRISIGDVTECKPGDWFSADATVTIYYYDGENGMNAKDSSRQGMCQVPNTSVFYRESHYMRALDEFQAAGFNNVNIEKVVESKKTIINKNYGVVKITVDGRDMFLKGEWFNQDVPIVITYHVFEMGSGI